MPSDHVLHLNPVWRHRADYIIDAELEGEDLSKHFEQLWTKRVGDNEFEICCIPFFLYDLALGDVVSCGLDETGLMDRVIRPSGRFVFRARLDETEKPIDDVIAEFQQRGWLLEWYSRRWIALDAENGIDAQHLADYLAELEAGGRLSYETGR